MTTTTTEEQRKKMSKNLKGTEPASKKQKTTEEKKEILDKFKKGEKISEESEQDIVVEAAMNEMDEQAEIKNLLVVEPTSKKQKIILGRFYQQLEKDGSSEISAGKLTNGKFDECEEILEVKGKDWMWLNDEKRPYKTLIVFFDEANPQTLLVQIAALVKKQLPKGTVFHDCFYKGKTKGKVSVMFRFKKDPDDVSDNGDELIDESFLNAVKAKPHPDIYIKNVIKGAHPYQKQKVDGIGLKYFITEINYI